MSTPNTKQMTADELDAWIAQHHGWRQWVRFDKDPVWIRLLPPASIQDHSIWREATDEEKVANPECFDFWPHPRPCRHFAQAMLLLEDIPAQWRIENFGTEWRVVIDSVSQGPITVQVAEFWLIPQAISCAYYEFRTGTRVELVTDTQQSNGGG